MVDNGSIANAVTLNPQTLAIQPFSGVLVTPGRYTNISPRVDYQLGENNTLMFRYGIAHSDVQDNGIGGFDLPSRAYHTQFTNQTVQVADTQLIGQAVNETRFQYYRTASQMIANSSTPAVMVLQSFNDGGSTRGANLRYTELVTSCRTTRRFCAARIRGVSASGCALQADDNISPQNFNGTFTFAGGELAPVLNAQNQPVVAQGQTETEPISSIESYRRTLLFQQLGYTPAQIRALGGGASQFSMTTGVAGLNVRQFDAGFFVGDEWRVRPNFTLNLGLRYETQSNLHDYRDFAPRVAFAWAPGGRGEAGRDRDSRGIRHFLRSVPPRRYSCRAAL